MEDIPLLAAHFLQKYHHVNPKVTAVAPESLDILQGYSYPGNVRELENIIERAMILENGTLLSPASLLISGNNMSPALEKSMDSGLNIKSAEKEHILQVLELCNGRKMEAARMLCINKTTLWRKMRKYGIGHDR
jgi:DNA-binding NtrC family response regulator